MIIITGAGGKNRQDMSKRSFDDGTEFPSQ
jgi:hypothetical protein